MKRRTWKAKVASKHLRWAYFLRCHQWCDANSSLCPPQCQNEILLEDLPKPSSLPPPKKYGNPGGNSVAEKKKTSSNLTRQWRIPQRFKVEKLGWRSFLPCQITRGIEAKEKWPNRAESARQIRSSGIVELQWPVGPASDSQFAHQGGQW